MTTELTQETMVDRLARIVEDIELGMDCSLRVGTDEAYDLDGADISRFYLQVQCYRRDVITGQMGWGYGGKAYLSPHMPDSEIVQVAFGLYKGYWEHEARENFQWRGRRVFGPHISTEALWEVAPRVDVRSARHEEDARR